jgi:hypothetical protein
MLSRQTGMYRFTNTITDEHAHAMVADVCAASKCQRRVLWPLRDAAELVYWLGQRPACRIVRQGRVFTSHEAF